MYESGASKNFLDETSFPTEDDLSDFKFGKAYMNWLTLIEAVPEPVVDLVGMLTTNTWFRSGFQDWAQARQVHDHLLHSFFMLKPFILDISTLPTRSN